MIISIIGAGGVGSTLGRALGQAGHTIRYAVRDAAASRHDGLRADGAAVLPVREAVEGAEAVLLATPWNATQAALESAGDLTGKLLIDATNPIGPGFSLTHGHDDSGAEQVQRWAPGAKVVKAFNTTGVENMADPVYGDARAMMFVCGDDEAATEQVAQLARDIGFDGLAIGKLDRARLLEPTALLWIHLAIVRREGRNIAFGLLRREEG